MFVLLSCDMQHPSLQDLCERVLGSSVDLLAVILSTGDGVPICRGTLPIETQNNMWNARAVYQELVVVMLDKFRTV
jgi:hypothetical protein